jgi:type I restriction enzyme S subunit
VNAVASLPNGWASTRLEEVGLWYGGGTPSKSEPRYWEKGTVPWVSPKDMKSLLIRDSEDHISSAALEESRVGRYPKGTVLIVMRSGILSRTLPVAVSEIAGTMNQDLKGVRPITGIVPLFLAYQLIAREREVLSGCSKHGTTVASIDTGRLHDLDIRVPPTNEQRRIVAKIEELFSDLDAGVAALERVKANLKRYRAAVLKAAVEGRLTEEWRKHHPDVEPAGRLLERILAERRKRWEAEQVRKYAEAGKAPPKGWKERYEAPVALEVGWRPPTLPSGWTWCTVSQAAAFDDNSITDGPFGSNLKTEHYTSSGPRVIRLQNVGDGEFVDEHAHITEAHFKALSRHHLASGDLVIAMMGDWLPRACQIPQSALPAIVKADCARFAGNASVGSPAYFNVALNAKPTRDLASRRIKGVGRPRLNLSSVRAIALPLPPLAEQAEIVAEVDRRLSVADAAEVQVEHALQRAARLRQSILKLAFEGQLVPQDPQDEPAEVLLQRVRGAMAQEASARAVVPRSRRKARAARTHEGT